MVQNGHPHLYIWKERKPCGMNLKKLRKVRDQKIILTILGGKLLISKSPGIILKFLKIYRAKFLGYINLQILKVQCLKCNS